MCDVFVNVFVFCVCALSSSANHDNIRTHYKEIAAKHRISTVWMVECVKIASRYDFVWNIHKLMDEKSDKLLHS